MFTVHRDNRVFPRMDGVWVCTDGFSLWLSLAASIHQWLMIITGYWTHLCSWWNSVVRSTNALHLFILSTLWSAPTGYCRPGLAHSSHDAVTETQQCMQTHISHRLFKGVPLLQGERVSLGNDRNDVDHLTEMPHKLHIQRPKTGRWKRQQNSTLL